MLSWVEFGDRRTKFIDDKEVDVGLEETDEMLLPLDSIPIQIRSFGSCFRILNYSPKGPPRDLFFDLDFSPLHRGASSSTSSTSSS